MKLNTSNQINYPLPHPQFEILVKKKKFISFSSRKIRVSSRYLLLYNRLCTKKKESG